MKETAFIRSGRRTATHDRDRQTSIRKSFKSSLQKIIHLHPHCSAFVRHDTKVAGEEHQTSELEPGQFSNFSSECKNVSFVTESTTPEANIHFDQDSNLCSL